MRYAPLLTSPGHLWASRISTWAPSHWKQRPPPRPAQLPTICGTRVRSLRPLNHRCLCRSPWALFSVLKLSQYRACRPMGCRPTPSKTELITSGWTSASLFSSLYLCLYFQHFCLTWARNWHMKVNRVWFLLSRSSLSSRRKQLWRQICAKYWNRCCNRRI